MGGIVEDRQTFDHLPLGSTVEHEIRRPDLVGGIRPDQRLSIRYQYLLALLLRFPQARLGVEPIHVLVIDLPAGPLQLQIDYERAMSRAGGLSLRTSKQATDFLAGSCVS